MENTNTKTVLFITGAFVNSHCWDEWKAYFESRGYTCIAPAWPNKDASAGLLRSRQPNPDIASNRLEEVIKYYADTISRLPEKPIIIGHSIGGLMAQVLLNRGQAAAAVAIHSVAPQGIIPTQWSFYRATFAALGFFTSTKKAYMMSFKKWQYAFTNGMTEQQQREGYERFAIPESKLLLRDGLTKVAKVDYSKAHNPLLILAGDADHCVPASLNKTNFKKYPQNGSITDFKVMPGRNHFVLGQPTWREDADYILNWLDKQMVKGTKSPNRATLSAGVLN